MSEIKEKLTPEQIKVKLIDKLRPSGWANLLKGYLQSDDFQKIIEFLISQNAEGKRFTPSLKQLFTAFELCPVDKLKVIMLGQDPYPQPFVADGIAFSCGNTKKPEASLRYILGAIEKDVPFADQDATDADTRYDLSRWSRQGILSINTALTTELTKAGKHTGIWVSFMEYLIDMINFNQSGLIWVLMGKQAQEYQSLIGDHHKVLTCTHPAYAAYMKAKEWDCNNVFNKINSQLVDYNKEKIRW
jgi:uracil-DNA glycosylase